MKNQARHDSFQIPETIIIIIIISFIIIILKFIVIIIIFAIIILSLLFITDVIRIMISFCKYLGMARAEIYHILYIKILAISILH